MDDEMYLAETGEKLPFMQHEVAIWLDSAIANWTILRVHALESNNSPEVNFANGGLEALQATREALFGR